MASAPRPAAARSTAAARRSVTLDLDTIEREDAPEPMTINCGGKVITLVDIFELDWMVAATLSPDRPNQFFETVVPADDYETFLAQGFPLWKIRLMANAYRAHFGIDELGNSNG